MNALLYKSSIQSRQLTRIPAIRCIVLGPERIDTIIRPISFKTTANLSRKEREIVRYRLDLFSMYRRRHVKEGNTITYIGAGVNILLSGMKVAIVQFF